MPIIKLPTLLGATVVFCLSACYLQAENNRLTDRLNEVVAAHIQYSKKMQRQRGLRKNDFVQVFDVENGTEAVSQTLALTTKYCFQKDCFLFQAESPIHKGRYNPTCDSINSQYCFSLSRKRFADPWSIFKYSISSDPELNMSSLGHTYPYQKPSQQDLELTFMPGIDGVGGLLRLSELVTLAEFELHRADEDAENGFLTLTFSYGRQGFLDSHGEPQSATFEAELVLDSANSYLPVRLIESCQMPNESHHVSTTVDRTYSGDLAVKENQEQRFEFSIGRKKLVSRKEVETRYEFGSVPEKEFTLTAFGFLEPSELNKPRWNLPSHVWALLIGVSLVGIALFVKVRQT